MEIYFKAWLHEPNKTGYHNVSAETLLIDEEFCWNKYRSFYLYDLPIAKDNTSESLKLNIVEKVETHGFLGVNEPNELDDFTKFKILSKLYQWIDNNDLYTKIKKRLNPGQIENHEEHSSTLFIAFQISLPVFVINQK